MPESCTNLVPDVPLMAVVIRKIAKAHSRNPILESCIAEPVLAPKTLRQSLQRKALLTASCRTVTLLLAQRVSSRPFLRGYLVSEYFTLQFYRDFVRFDE